MIQFLTIDDARKDIERLSPGDRIAFTDSDGIVRIGTVRFKRNEVEGMGILDHLGANYVYAQYRAGEKVTDKYIGKQILGES